jgi:hypothetical protein
MLEFFRRSAPAESGAPSSSSSSALEPTTRMLVLRRSQAVVAGCAAAAALLLAFLVGHAVGASGGGDVVPGPEVYVIRAVSYADDDKGRSFARTMKEHLEQMDLGEEVGVVQVPSESHTVVTVGSWLSDPAGRKEARALREKLRALKDKTQAMPFANAEFWRMER